MIWGCLATLQIEGVVDHIVHNVIHCQWSNGNHNLVKEVVSWAAHSWEIAVNTWIASSRHSDSGVLREVREREKILGERGALPRWSESLKTLDMRLCWPPSDIDNMLLKWERCESINIRVVNIIQEWPQRRQEIQKLQNNVQILRANKFVLSQFWHTLEGFSLRTPFHRWGYQSFTEWSPIFAPAGWQTFSPALKREGLFKVQRV